MQRIYPKVKNILALLLYTVFVAIFLRSFFAEKIIYEHIEVISNEIEEKNATSIIENDLLDSYYTENNINLINILNAEDDEIKEKLVTLLNKYRTEKVEEISGDARRKMLTLYENTLIVGDSQVAHIRYTGALESKYLIYMPGLTLTEQLDEIEEHLKGHENVKNVILWNGYNIFAYKDANEFVEAYQKLIDKIHEFNPNIKVYVCSLLPARSDMVYQDLTSDVKHNIYKGPEYDQALREYFEKDNAYINTNFLINDKAYASDGFHFGPDFNFTLIPYLAYYTNLSYGSEDAYTSYEKDAWMVATNSTLKLGNFYDVKRDELVESPLRFKVLKNDGRYATCISYEIIDSIPYAKDADVEYKDSYLRKYLNDYFYKNCFNNEEKKILKPVYVDKDMKDYITVLSIDEYRDFINNGFLFSTDNSKYSHNKIDKDDNAYVSLTGNTWLRDSYYISYNYTNIYKIKHLSRPYNKFSLGVRPVIKIDIKSYLKYISEENNDVQEKEDYDKFYEDYFGKLDYSRDAYKEVKNRGNKAILTFDDGPSELTRQILDILAENELKATFFLCDYADKDKEIIQRMIDEGHTIGIHCFNHYYEELYTSEDMFVENLEKLRNKLKVDFGIEPKIMRFPGGSANENSLSYEKGIMTKLVKTMHDKGYEFYDWSVTSGDANPIVTADIIFNSVVNGLNPFKQNVILFHDAKEHIHTVEALPFIIEYLKSRSYEICPIDDKSLPIYNYVVN